MSILASGLGVKSSRRGLPNKHNLYTNGATGTTNRPCLSPLSPSRQRDFTPGLLTEQMESQWTLDSNASSDNSSTHPHPSSPGSGCRLQLDRALGTRPWQADGERRRLWLSAPLWSFSPVDEKGHCYALCSIEIGIFVSWNLVFMFWSTWSVDSGWLNQ